MIGTQLLVGSFDAENLDIAALIAFDGAPCLASDRVHAEAGVVQVGAAPDLHIDVRSVTADNTLVCVHAGISRGGVFRCSHG